MGNSSIIALLLVSVVLVVVVIGMPPFDQPKTGWGGCYPGFESDVDQIAGEAALDCGFWNAGEPKKRLAEIASCAKNAVGAEKAFKFGQAGHGDDSSFCYAAIRDGSSQFWSFFYDSDVSGGNGGPPSISVSRCDAVVFEQGTVDENSFFNLTGCNYEPEISEKLLEKLN